MKLVDILALNMGVWPEGLDCLSQLKGTGYIINGKGFDGRAFDALEIADETHIAGAIVTRAEWKAAVDALNAPKAAEWNGEGLPPAGAVCELKKAMKFTEGTRLDEFPAGTELIVGGHANFYGNPVLAVCVKNRNFTGTLTPECLRPLRTPEQIAAEERERAIADMKSVFDSCLDVLMPTSNQYLETLFGAIHDTGYRKFEIIEEPQS